ncbi:MAG: phosphate ABC transporter substrate-binding protein, partial [Lachnospiraceae bacterium]|nr:phosphate ABC transporter substrate-binding protein [Lachnospiraceae bacterium]
MKFRKVAVLTMIGAMAMSMTAFADSDLSKLSGDISCTGSSALQPLVQAAADKFADVAPGVNITVDAGGSGQGLQNVSDGTSTVGDSDVFAEEKLDKDKAAELVDHQVCAIGMAVVVSQDVADGGVKSLTTDQLVSIFTGETTNWKDVGGPDEDITLVLRPEGSGTRATFDKYALGGAEEAGEAMENDNSAELQKALQDTNGSVGYLALSYILPDEAKDAMKGIATVAINDVEPTLENIYSGKYDVWAYEHMYTKG